MVLKDKARLTVFFEKCQEDGQKVDAVVREMLPQLKVMKPKEIVTELLWHVFQVFNADERVTSVNAVDKVLDCVTTAVVTAGDLQKRSAAKKKASTEECCNEVFERFSSKLLKNKFLLCENAYVRRLCCQLFSRLMAGLPSDTDVSEELFTELTEAICDRLTDRSPAVRQAAARAAWRLQDPYSEDCPVATALAIMAANDHHMGCRLAAVETIHIPTIVGTPAVIGRLADVCEAVRRAAMRRLCQRQDGSVVSVRVLTAEHVRTVLARVVCEPSSKLRQSYGQQLLVRRWLDDDCRGDICSFLALINVDTCRDLGKRTLQFFLSSEPDRLEKICNIFTIPAFASNGTTNTSLTVERVFGWTVLLDYAYTLKSSRKEIEEYYSKLMPKKSSEDEDYKWAFVDYVFNYLVDLFDSPPADDVDLHSFMFVGEHLLAVFRHYCRSLDAADLETVVGRLSETLGRDKVHPHFVDLMTKTLCELLGNGVPAVTRVSALVSELLDPDHSQTKRGSKPQSAEKHTVVREDPNVIREAELRVAGLRVKLNEMRDELDELIRLQRYEDAAQCREHIDGLKEELAEAVANKLHVPIVAKKQTEGEEEEEEDLAIGTQQLVNQRLEVIQHRPEVATKLLSILGSCLEQCRSALPPGSGLITELRSLFDDFVVSSIATPCPSVRAAALRVLGHCCCIDRDLAISLHSTFIVQLQLDIPSKVLPDFGKIPSGPIAAMRVLTDIAMRHGFDVFTTDCEIANAIAAKLSDPDTAIQRTAGECLAQLLLSGRCPRKQMVMLLSRLVHLWFDADLATGRDLDPHSELLRASLAAFFRMFPTQSASSLSIFAEALFATLRLVDDDNIFSRMKPHGVSLFFGQKISPDRNADLPSDLHSKARVIQLSVANFLLNSVYESVMKIKQREQEEEEKEKSAENKQSDDADLTTGGETDEASVKKEKSQKTPNDRIQAKEYLWYRIITVATTAFISTVNINASIKQNPHLHELFSIANKLLTEDFEAKLPVALVRRRCRKDVENFFKSLCNVLSIEPSSVTAAVTSAPSKLFSTLQHKVASVDVDKVDNNNNNTFTAVDESTTVAETDNTLTAIAAVN